VYNARYPPCWIVWVNKARGELAAREVGREVLNWILVRMTSSGWNTETLVMPAILPAMRELRTLLSFLTPRDVCVEVEMGFTGGFSVYGIVRRVVRRRNMPPPCGNGDSACGEGGSGEDINTVLCSLLQNSVLLIKLLKVK